VQHNSTARQLWMQWRVVRKGRSLATITQDVRPVSDTQVSTGGVLVPASELVELAASDPELYCRTFFPHTFRQRTPLFHRDIWAGLESRRNRYVATMVFRGGAKTTLLRAFTSKRIAYATSRTILYTSAAVEHAQRSVRWLRKAVERQDVWAKLFALTPGDKWGEEHLEIKHGIAGCTISVVPVGITGQVRGINIDDYRPDLIVVDDPCDEENTATPEQRKKVEDRFFGSLMQGLTPVSESPDAKMVLLQTPLNREDLVNQCVRDPAWTSYVFGILDEDNESRWAERYPTAEVMQEKREYSERNQLPIWLREKMCQVVSEATAYFRKEWLQYWEVYPKGLRVVIGIDPVPPPSELQLQKGLAGKDYEVLFVLGFAAGRFYVLEISAMRGHEPEWTENEFFRLMDKWKPVKVRVEGMGYQRTLKSNLERAMRRKKRFVQIDAVDDKRKKSVRIKDAFSGIGSQKRLYLHPSMLEFETQWVAYPDVGHDDILDAGAMAVDCALDMDIFMGGDEDGDDPMIDSFQKDRKEEWRVSP